MARREIGLGGQSADMDSRLSRQEIINGYIETNQDGSFKRIQRTQGLTKQLDLNDYPSSGLITGISQVYTIKDRIFIAGIVEISDNDEIFVFDEEFNFISSELIEVPDNKKSFRFDANGADNNQVIVVASGIDGAGVQASSGLVYEVLTDTWTPVIDVDFTPDVGIASLNQRLWFNVPNSNKFLGSEVANALDYSSLDQASAEQNPDILLYPVSLKTALYLMGAKTIEYWQTVNASFPVRPVAGATIQRGVGAKLSVAEFEDNIFFLADDFTVRVVSGSSIIKVSNLALENAISGYAELEGYTNPEDAIAFFIDAPIHKLYCITFAANNVTWCFDITTKLWHKRSSNGNEWRIETAEKFNNAIYCGGTSEPFLYFLDNSNYTESGETMKFSISTPVIYSSTTGFTITEMEMVAETGVGTISNQFPILDITKTLPENPMIMVEFSRDGGATWVRKSSVSIGRIGNRGLRVISRRFGYTKRHGDFMFRFSVTDNVPVTFYTLHADIENNL